MTEQIGSGSGCGKWEMTGVSFKDHVEKQLQEFSNLVA